MSAVDAPPVGIKQTGPPGGGKEPTGQKAHRFLASIPTWVLWGLVVLWTIPTIGLFVNSFRPKGDQLTTGWWTAFSDPNFRSNAFFRFGPTPGIVSSADCIPLFCRTPLWYVMAKRCASSRMRCTR